MGGRRASSLALAAVAGLALLAASIAGVAAGFVSVTGNDGNSITSADDFRAPAVAALAVGKQEGGATAFVRSGGAYYVYADVEADGGNPPSGAGPITADVSALTDGETAVELVPGSYSAGGESYSHRAGPLTADAGLAAGAAGFTVTTTDLAGNEHTEPGSATVDDTAPEAADVQAEDGGGTPGLAEEGDLVTLTFGEPVDPVSALDGWDGAPAPVVARLYDGGAGSDYLRFFDAGDATELGLGVVELGGEDYAVGDPGGHVTFGATGAPATLELDGDRVTVLLGAYAAPGAAVRDTQLAGSTAVWTPGAALTDRAGNLVDPAPAVESGPTDVEL